MIKNPIYKLYYIAGGAFSLALAKYFFVSEIEFLPKFFIIEFISFGLFLGIVYFFDKYIRDIRKQNHVINEDIEKTNRDHKQKVVQLEKRIKELRGEKENDSNSDAEIRKLTQKIIKGLDIITSNEELARQLLNNLALYYEVGLGILYMLDKPSNKYSVKATYGLNSDIKLKEFTIGEGLCGQAVVDKEYMVITDVEDNYFNIESGSGESKPKNIYLLPIVKDNECIGLIEIATFGFVNIEKHWENLNNSIANTMSL